MQTMLKRLKQKGHLLTKQQFKTLKGQILSGDIIGAEKGLNKILNTKKRGNDYVQINNQKRRPIQRL